MCILAPFDYLRMEFSEYYDQKGAKFYRLNIDPNDPFKNVTDRNSFYEKLNNLATSGSYSLWCSQEIATIQCDSGDIISLPLDTLCICDIRGGQAMRLRPSINCVVTTQIGPFCVNTIQIDFTNIMETIDKLVTNQHSWTNKNVFEKKQSVVY